MVELYHYLLKTKQIHFVKNKGDSVLETSTVIGIGMGIISVFVGMVIKGAPISVLVNPAAFLIILGGTISCLFIGFRMEHMKNFPTLIKMTTKASITGAIRDFDNVR